MTGLPVGISVRPLSPGDGERCAAIYLAGRRVAFPWVPVEKLALDDFRRDTAGETVSVALSEDGQGGEIVLGFVSVYRRRRFIHHLYVHPACRRRGIGRALLGHAVASLRRPCRLKCVVANEVAMAFYRAQGWEEEGRGRDALGAYAKLRLAN